LSDKWDAISLEEISDKNYSDELAFALAIPGIILSFLLTILAVILCFQHEKM
jgi:alpha-sarcoglycan